MLTEAEKKELEALKAKADLTADEKTRLAALEAKSAEGAEGGEETFSKAYVEALRKESAKYRIRAKELDEKLAALDGVDKAKYDELMAAQAKAEQDKLEGRGEWDKLRAQLIEAHAGELSKKDKEIAELKSTINKLENDLGATIRSHEVSVQASIAKAINPSLVDMVVQSKTKIETGEDGRRVVRVLDTDGAISIDPKTGKPKTVAQLLQDLKSSTEYAHLFEGGYKGAGSGTETFNGKSIKNPWKADSSNLTLQGQIIRDNPDTAKRLITEAGKDPATYGL